MVVQHLYVVADTGKTLLFLTLKEVWSVSFIQTKINTSSMDILFSVLKT